MSIYYICSAFTAISAFVSFGFSIEAFIKAKNLDGSASTNAMYAISRSSALVLGSIVPFFFYSISYLAAITIIMVMVQAFDAFIGYKIKNNFKTFGPMLTSIGNLFCFTWLLY